MPTHKHYYSNYDYQIDEKNPSIIPAGGISFTGGIRARRRIDPTPPVMTFVDAMRETKVQEQQESKRSRHTHFHSSCRMLLTE